MGSLYRSHRTFGRELARVRVPDGQELVILEISPTKREVAPAAQLLPVSADDAAFEARMALAGAIERARFLGLDEETLRALFAEEIERSIA